METTALIARLRSRAAAGAEAERTEAFRRVFGTPLGRIVLAEIMAQGGIGARCHTGATADDRAYAAGRYDLAVDIRDWAGFDQASAIVAQLSGELEGQNHDGSSDGHDDGDPEPEYGG